jgi:hypothetical protein
MPLIKSTGGLLRAVNTKADKLLGLGTAILCLPAIITGAGDIFKDVFASLKATALKSITNLIGGLTGIVESIIADSISKVIGGISSSLSKVVKAIATVKGIIGGIQNFITDLTSKINDALNFTRDSEKCKYAAATLLKCVIAQTTSELLSDKKLALNISKGFEPLSKLSDKLAKSAAAPGGSIQRYIDKSASAVDVATTKINAVNLI